MLLHWGFTLKGIVLWGRWEIFRLDEQCFPSWLSLLHQHLLLQWRHSKNLPHRWGGGQGNASQPMFMKTRARVEQVKRWLAGQGRGLIAWTVQWNPTILSWFLLYAQGNRCRGSALSPHDFPKCVNGRAIHRPLCDTHMPQVWTCMAWEAFAVFEEFTTEFTANITGRFLLLSHNCRRKRVKRQQIELGMIQPSIKIIENAKRKQTKIYHRCENRKTYRSWLDKHYLKCLNWNVVALGCSFHLLPCLILSW